MFDFRMSVIYIDSISDFGLSVCFWQIKNLVLFWCESTNRFKESWEDVNNNARPKSLSPPKTDRSLEVVKEMILDNRRITITELADDVDISFGSCQAIFTHVLGMKCAAAKIVTRLQNFEQNQRRMVIAQEMLMTIQICSNRS